LDISCPKGMTPPRLPAREKRIPIYIGAEAQNQSHYAEPSVRLSPVKTIRLIPDRGFGGGELFEASARTALPKQRRTAAVKTSKDFCMTPSSSRFKCRIVAASWWQPVATYLFCSWCGHGLAPCGYVSFLFIVWPWAASLQAFRRAHKLAACGYGQRLRSYLTIIHPAWH